MGKTLKAKLDELSPQRRKKIEEESNLLIAEEMTRQQLRLALKLTYKWQNFSKYPLPFFVHIFYM
ncbi:MAG TPA: hypothetical protein IGS40_07675 [Trichormus sp. M33_DOE_039]|nr:hypothetical protein [Trichormus sp. M33_DOE_039]